jgi:putative inorganic carbon (hco3(-)) transporter
MDKDFKEEETDMTENKNIKYLIISIIILSTTFHYAAYAVGFLAFFALLIKEPKSIGNFILKEKTIIFAVAALLLSTIFSKVPGYSVIIGGIILIHLMVYLVITKWVDTDNIGDIYKVLNFMAILISIYGIYQHFTGDLSINASWTDQGAYGFLVRIYSTMRNPNIFATYLTFNICYAGAYFIKKGGGFYTAANIMLSSICLILTYSRGGFIAFIAAMIVIIIISKEIKAGVYLAFMILLYYGFNSLESTNRIDLSTIAVDGSSLYRLEIWKASWDLFKENVIFGSGLGSVSKLLSFSSDKLKGFIFHAHNIPLHLLAETGIVGFTVFLALVLSGIRKFISFWKEHKNSGYSYIAIGFIAALTAMIVHGLVDCVIFIPSRSLIFLIYLALFPAVFHRICNEEKT